jgi:hypothetical protein
MNLLFTIATVLLALLIYINTQLMQSTLVSLLPPTSAHQLSHFLAKSPLLANTSALFFLCMPLSKMREKTFGSLSSLSDSDQSSTNSNKTVIDEQTDQVNESVIDVEPSFVTPPTTNLIAGLEEYADNEFDRPTKSKPAAGRVKKASRPSFTFDPCDLEGSVAHLKTYIDSRYIYTRDLEPIMSFIGGLLNSCRTSEAIVESKDKTIAQLKKEITALQKEGLAQQANDVRQLTRPLFSQIVNKNNGAFNAANKITKQRSPRPKHVLVVETKGPQTAKDAFKTHIDPVKMKLKINEIRTGRNKKAIIITEDHESLAKINNHIEQSQIPDLVVRKPHDPRFQVSICLTLDDRNEYSTLPEKIAEQNDNLDCTDLKPLFVQKKSEQRFVVVFSVGRETRGRLIEGPRVFVGHEQVKFRDYLQPKKCFKCNKFSHLSRDCKTKQTEIKCTKCNEFGHETKKCRAEVAVASLPFCPSCHDSAKRTNAADPKLYAHWPDFSTCPTRKILIKKAQQKLSMLLNNEQ